MNTTTAGDHRSRLGIFASDYDYFGERFNFKLPGNKLKHGTKLGFCFTIFFVICLLSHAYLKTMKFLGVDESKYIMSYQ